jgi:hypothetical protein
MRVSDFLLREHGLQDLLEDSATHSALGEERSATAVALDYERQGPQRIG